MATLIRSLSFTKRSIINYLLKKPLCVSFEVTYNCNANCKHCHLGGAVKEVRASPQRFGELCRILSPVVAQISGGEPLLRHDLEEIVRAMHRPGKAPRIVVTTNGKLLTKKKYLELRAAGVDDFSLSLDYPDERHDEFRRIPGLFKQISSLMEDFEPGEDKAITLSCVVQSDNFRELIKMADLAHKWNTKINFSTYTWLRTNKKEYLIPKEEMPELRKIIYRLIEYKRKYKNIYTSDHIFKKMIGFFENHNVLNCRAGERFFVVNPDGTLSPCGLIIKEYASHREIKDDFLKHNDCVYCYTSLRGNAERPPTYLLRDNLFIFQKT